MPPPASPHHYSRITHARRPFQCPSATEDVPWSSGGGGGRAPKAARELSVACDRRGERVGPRQRPLPSIIQAIRSLCVVQRAAAQAPIASLAARSHTTVPGFAPLRAAADNTCAPLPPAYVLIPSRAAGEDAPCPSTRT